MNGWLYLVSVLNGFIDIYSIISHSMYHTKVNNLPLRLLAMELRPFWLWS